MDRLDRAVAAGIITAAQRDRIRALPQDPPGARLSLVNVLWVGGVGLIVFALWLLAVEAWKIDPHWLVWTCLVYAAGLWLLDALVVRHRAMRLLSALLVLGGGLCVSFAVIAWQGTVGQPLYLHDWDQVPSWSIVSPIRYSPLIHGIYLPLIPAVAVGIVLVRVRGFLPAWTVLTGAFYLAGFDVAIGVTGADPGSGTVMALVGVLFACGWAADLRLLDNHGFWLNKAAVTVFPVAAAMMMWDAGPGGALLWSVALIGLSVFIRRPGGLGPGAFGVAIWLGDWFGAWDNLFAAAALLAVIGVMTLFGGLAAHRNADRLDALLPAPLRRLRPAARTDPVIFGR